ncbi:hypothetical protein BDZ45DRAFT_749712 [Acephala macrosclerotiorum]|nr:hypothetical protein BDZ45DRAFT_749712 [Acephala macrosclerotiorum]
MSGISISISQSVSGMLTLRHCAQNKTYVHPSTRFHIFALHFSITADVVRRTPSNDAGGRILAAFESVGFVMDGTSLSNLSGSKIVIRKWGVPHDGVPIA